MHSEKMQVVSKVLIHPRLAGDIARLIENCKATKQSSTFLNM